MKRIQEIIAGNIGNKLTQELANGIYSAVLMEIERLVADARAQGATTSGGAVADGPEAANGAR
ncbi:hypothetical protein V8Z80_08590 [Orrella sp. JC864]|uniref:hypothetical protein n=1 Tax=Orrella sp. JC864 TaxID=3120298 RepID=UPI00300959A9